MKKLAVAYCLDRDSKFRLSFRPKRSGAEKSLLETLLFGIDLSIFDRLKLPRTVHTVSENQKRKKTINL